MQQVGLSFGRGHLQVAVPEAARATVIRKRPLSKLPDPAQAVRASLDNPVGGAGPAAAAAPAA